MRKPSGIIPASLRSVSVGARWALTVRRRVGRCLGPVWCLWYGGSVVLLYGPRRARFLGKLYCAATSSGAAARVRLFSESGRVDYVAPDKAKRAK